jgi:anti-anti-sigma factor
MSAQEELVTVELCEQCGIVIGGELDVLTAPVVLEVVPELAAIDAKPIDVDLSNVRFVDAAGVRALLCLKHAVPAVRVVAVSPTVERVLKIADAYDDLVDASISEPLEGIA